jgi:hypothetical protein
MRARSRLWEGTPPSYLDGKERWSDANAAAQVKSRLRTAKGARKCDVVQVSHTVAIIGCLIFVLYAAEHYTDSLVIRLQWSPRERDACCSVGKKTTVLFR